MFDDVQKSDKRDSLRDSSAAIAQRSKIYHNVVGTSSSDTMLPFIRMSIDEDCCFEYDYQYHHVVDTDSSDDEETPESDRDVESSD